MKLELGAGTRPTPGYTHQDIRELPHVEVVCDACHLPPDLKGKLDEIYGYHIIEHIPWRHLQAAINHWAAYLKPGGLLRMVAPDFQTLAEWLVEDPENNYIVERVGYMMMGSQTYPESIGAFEPTNAHHAMITARRMRTMFSKAGLVNIKVDRHNNRQPRGKHCPMVTATGRKPK